MKAKFIFLPATYVALTMLHVFSPVRTYAQTHLLVTLGTGGDDLRGGNKAFITLRLVGGGELTEQLLSSGLGSNSIVSTHVVFPDRTIPATEIRSIHIRHDGSPRPGHPFNTYDNWDLKTLRVTLVDATLRTIAVLYNSDTDSRTGRLVLRFTGDFRRLELPIRAIDTEPDFIITSISRHPRGVLINVRNIGLGAGRLTVVSCSVNGLTVERDLRELLPLGAGLSIPLPPVGFRGAGTGTCTIIGTDLRGRPERVTANNVFRHRF